MSTTALNPSAAPRADARSVWRRLWDALEAFGELRAEAQLRRMAALHAGVNPELSQRLRELADRSARG